IKHLCADMYVASEGAAAGVELVARTWEQRGELDEYEVVAAASYAFRAARDGSTAAMQIHGGIAFTWEHDAHWYLKRAESTRLITPGVDESAVADIVLADDFDIVSSLFAR